MSTEKHKWETNFTTANHEVNIMKKLMWNSSFSWWLFL